VTVATITVPNEFLLATRMTIEEIQLELAISLFVQEKLSFGKARELAGLDFWTFQQILGSRGIAPHYDIAELHEDLATIERLRQK
jgi:predicted HTH domain antitoxin